MSRLKFNALALAIALVAIGARTDAQVTINVGAGGNFPMGNYGEYANTGYVLSAGFLTPVGPKGVALGAQGLFAMNTHSTYDDDKTKLLGALATARYRFGDAATPGVFVVGNVGILRHQYSSDLFPSAESVGTGVAFGGGAGIDIPRGWATFYAVARYLTASIDSATIAFVPVQVGVSVPLNRKR